jgi:hypothetical protein
MSKVPPATTSATYFQNIFNTALEAYKKKTKKDLLAHPLSAKLQDCDSPAAILSVLEELVQQFDQRRCRNERLRSCLSPIVNVVYSISTTIGEGVGLVGPKLQLPYDPGSEYHLSGTSPSKGNTCWNGCPPFGGLASRFIAVVYCDARICRLRRMSTPAKMRWLIFLRVSKAFSRGSSHMQKCHRLLL